ncbi:VSP [Giardia lamblia P15]|uniref:VSP n=1 Tax=Giardia intestinalis (strain P15) TaxID=658858 RepID=E1EXV4_GIAIA|nr:VSP [Giardia lamblia P15]
MCITALVIWMTLLHPDYCCEQSSVDRRYVLLIYYTLAIYISIQKVHSVIIFSMFGRLLLLGFVLQLTHAEGECTPIPSGSPDTCKVCEAVIDGVNYCSQCNDDRSDPSSGAPTDGVCTTDNNECSQKANGKCTQCAHSSFMYKGGCYKDSQAPGNTMCQATDSNGVCTRAKDGYFVPPGADASHQSVIPCGDEEVVTIGSSKQYRGIPNCLTCTAPVNGDGADSTPKAPTCNACKGGFFVDASKESTCTACPANCLTCADGTAERCKSCTAETHFLGATDGQEGKCVSCGTVQDAWSGVANCAKCSKPTGERVPAICKECADGFYLKTGEPPSCAIIEECTGGFFSTTDNTGKRVCTTCGDTANGGITECSECAPTSQTAKTDTVAITCSKCNKGKVSPGRTSCIDACPENSTENPTGTCVCNSGYSPDEAGTSCVAVSTNLSTGAIAGIAVAVVVVVGGLVGFLCWWFLCQGKA